VAGVDHTRIHVVNDDLRHDHGAEQRWKHPGQKGPSPQTSHVIDNATAKIADRRQGRYRSIPYYRGPNWLLNINGVFDSPRIDSGTQGESCCELDLPRGRPSNCQCITALNLLILGLGGNQTTFDVGSFRSSSHILLSTTSKKVYKSVVWFNAAEIQDTVLDLSRFSIHISCATSSYGL
jgi:hypothetical protein